MPGQIIGLGRQVPPAWEQVIIFFDQAGFPIQARDSAQRPKEVEFSCPVDN